MMNDSMYKKFIITEEHKEYLSTKDKVFQELIKAVGSIENYYIPDSFTALVNSIVFQAISFKAASTIWNRFIELVGNVTYENVLAMANDEIRACGLSKSKVSYIKNIAIAFKNKEINLTFNDMDNNCIIKELEKIKGIGRWTSEMFLIFCLFRKDIISFKDLAIRRGLEWLYDIDHELTETEFKQYMKKFSPYNTIASLYIWEITLRNMFRFQSIYDVV